MLIDGTVMWVVAGCRSRWRSRSSRCRARTGVWHTLGVLALTTYLFWMASAGFFPMPIEDSSGFSVSRVNLVPLRDFVASFGYLSPRQIIRQHGGNFLLLVPFTLVGRALWPRFRAWKWALAIGVGGSVIDRAAAARWRRRGRRRLPIGGHRRRHREHDGRAVGYALFLGVRRAVVGASAPDDRAGLGC